MSRHRSELHSISVDVHPGPASDVEREKNRKLLATLHQSHVTHMDEVEDFKKDMLFKFGELRAEFERMRGELRQCMGELSDMRRSSQQVTTEVRSIKEQVAQELKTTAGQVTTEVRSIKEQVAQELKTTEQSSIKIKGEVSESQRKVQESQQKVQENQRKVQENQRKVQENERQLQESQRQLQENQRQVQGLKQEVLSKQGAPSHEVMGIKATVQQVYSEFNALRKQIFDRGLLAPVRTEPVKEESPPVGTLGLGEDIFTARLLIRLGFLRARVLETLPGDASEAEDARPLAGENGLLGNGVAYSASDPSSMGHSDSDDEFNHELARSFKNVSGIPEPVVDEDAVGYLAINCGWPMVCSGTLGLQLLVLCLMIRFYIHTHDCFETLPVPFEDVDWWILHSSRGIAMLIAGAFMTKDIMDIVNFLMVSALLEHRLNLEVVASAVVRAVLITMLFAANLFLFRSYKDPGYLWVNMAAVSFVGSFGSDVLAIAKSGCFGHHICKAVTAVNYELTFLSEYPSWFPYVSKVTLSVAMVGVMVTSIAVFVDSDYECEALS